jgi:hypothetical protein
MRKGSPVFVATFADGETVRMTTYCDGKLDWERGRSLARHAWQTRDRRHRIETHDRRHRIEEFLANIEDRTPPEITRCWFETDSGVVSEPSEGEPNNATAKGHVRVPGDSKQEAA